MAVHTIDVTPRWVAVVRIVVGVMENNKVGSKEFADSKKHLFHMATKLDTLNDKGFITQEMLDAVEERMTYESTL